MTTSADFATFPRTVAIGLGFNLLIAVGLAIAQHYPLGQTLVFSNCIGLSILLLVDVPRRLIWGSGIPPASGITILSVAGIVAGFVLGTVAASLLLGFPIERNLSGDGLVTGGVITAFAGIAGCWYFMNRARLQTIQRAAAEARLKLLQAQIEPHFLFNTLANLHTLIGSDPARARKMLEHLNDYLRATLGAARRDMGTLADEYALLRGYLEVLAVRMGPRLSFTLTLPEELAGVKLPPMLLQPLVENAIKHGLEPKIEGGHLEVRSFRKDKAVVVEVADSGLGLLGAGQGVGVDNVRERLRAINGTLDLQANPAGGATAIVRIPL